MKLLYPAGLLALIGIPILILIYIIKNTYTEQTIASTYMWRLSERFIKRRNPLSKLTGIISLVLQLLFVVSVALAMAGPIIVTRGTASEYCFVIDGSASMNMEEDGVTRFERAKQEVIEIVSSAKNGSVFSVIVADDTASLLISSVSDKDEVIDRISSLECGSGSIDTAGVLGKAQQIFNSNPSVKTYFVTDTDVTVHENIELINVRSAETNYSLDNVSYTDAGGGQYIVTGTVTAYGSDGTVDVQIFSDISDGILGTVSSLYIPEGESVEFETVISSDEFYSLTVRISAGDSLSADDTATVYNLKSENSYKALIVSDEPLFLEAALEIVSSADTEVMSSAQYSELLASLDENERVSGYGLYIFDTYTPRLMPKDGTVWFFAPIGNVEGSDFQLNGEVELERPVTLTVSQSTSSIVTALTEGMAGNKISVIKYYKYSVQSNFTTILSYMGQPMVFTGVNTYGNREVVFAFDLHDSDLALAASDFLPLVRNLLDYSFPEVVERTEYYCGDTAEVNVISGCNSIKVICPSGTGIYTDISSSAVSKLQLDEVGEYKIIADISGNEREFYIYSSVPREERDTAPVMEYMSLVGEAENNGIDGEYDISAILFILAALLFAAEWAVYCYDKYQIR